MQRNETLDDFIREDLQRKYPVVGVVLVSALGLACIFLACITLRGCL
jgi:hypothetical protein